MRNIEDDPLPFGLWAAEMGALADCCAVARPGGEDRSVRRAFYLFKLSEPSLQSLADPSLGEDDVEQRLERDGPEAAIKLIAGDRASFAVARAGHDPSRIAAEISFGDGSSARAEANSAACAMVGAWANYFRTAR